MNICLTLKRRHGHDILPPMSSPWLRLSPRCLSFVVQTHACEFALLMGQYVCALLTSSSRHTRCRCAAVCFHACIQYSTYTVYVVTVAGPPRASQMAQCVRSSSKRQSRHKNRLSTSVSTVTLRSSRVCALRSAALPLLPQRRPVIAPRVCHAAANVRRSPAFSPPSFLPCHLRNSASGYRAAAEYTPAAERGGMRHKARARRARAPLALRSVVQSRWHVAGGSGSGVYGVAAAALVHYNKVCTARDAHGDMSPERRCRRLAQRSRLVTLVLSCRGARVDFVVLLLPSGHA